MGPLQRAYLIANSPGWLLTAILMWIAVRHFELPEGMGVTLVVVFILKDLLLYPLMRHYYRSEPSERRIIGERGRTLTALGPRGLVRVHGEIWQAEPVRDLQHDIPEGANVRVHDIRGLLLFVKPD
jgi:membrane protein implicated in regulation of membrane protease activity